MIGLSAAVIAELVRAGLSGDALISACERIEAADARCVGTGVARSVGAIRQARYRARKAPDDVTNLTKSVTNVTSVTIPPSPPIPPLEDNTQNPPLTPPSCQMLAKRERAGKWHRLPDDWQPGPLPEKLAAKAAQWPPGVIDDHEANFRGWAANAPDTNGKGRKLNWDMAWHNWLRDKQNYGTSNRAGSSASPRKTGSGGKRTVADFLADGGFH